MHQVISFDFSGRHNGSLANGADRILVGATWKKQRIVVLIPAAGSIPAKVYMAHQVLTFPRNQQVTRMLCLGDEVGEAYSNAVAHVLEDPVLSGFEYILTLEHDNTPPPDGLLRLIARMDAHPEFAAIGGLYWEKGEDGQPQCWGDVKDPVINFRPQPPPPVGELGEYYGVPMGFTLWRMSMFKDPRLPRPFFTTVQDANQYESDTATQDLAFWRKAWPLGYRCAIDAGVLVGHYCSATDIVW
jgi:hypothetical protein